VSSAENKNNTADEIVVSKINLNGLIIELPFEMKFVDGVFTKEAFLAALMQAIEKCKQQKETQMAEEE